MEVDMKLIRVSDEAHETIRRLAYEGRISMREVVDIMLLMPATDPRTPAERAADDFAAEVLDTQASDRP
jgi:hypothetical protein